MLRMPTFEVHQPASIEEAVQLKAALPSSLYVAGGTDLLPNLKHWLHEPEHLVALNQVAGLRGVTVGAEAVTIGAGTALQDVADHPWIGAELPGLAAAVASIAGPQHRRMGTLGGNVMLDTRCLFYNQTKHWRQSVGYCLKREGTWCHVIGSDKACVAAQSSDSVPMLVALGAELEVFVPGDPKPEARTVSLVDVFTKDGRFELNHALPPHALLTAIRVPVPGPGHRSVYRKVRSREAVDFPQLSVALAGRFDERDVCLELQVVIGAMLPFPKVVPAAAAAVGQPLTDAMIEQIAAGAGKQARPQAQIHGASDWRRHLAGIETRRGLLALRGEA